MTFPDLKFRAVDSCPMCSGVLSFWIVEPQSNRDGDSYVQMRRVRADKIESRSSRHIVAAGGFVAQPDRGRCPTRRGGLMATPSARRNA